MRGAIGMGDVDFALRPCEAEREPLLRLAAILAAPGLPDEIARNVVFEPFANFAESFDGMDVGFLAQLPQRRRPWLFAGIDAALRHLPRMGQIDVLRTVDTAADKGVPGAVEHRQADTRTIGKVFVGHGGSIVRRWQSEVSRPRASTDASCFVIPDPMIVC